MNKPAQVPQPKNAASSLITSDQLYRQLIHTLPTAVYTCDTEGYITLFNEAAATLWGRSPVIGKEKWCGSHLIFKPDGTPVALDTCPMAMTVKEGRAVRGEEIVIERPDGSRVNVLPYPQPLFDESGNLIGAVNMLMDISDRKRDEISSLRLAAIVTSSEDAIISKELDGTITSWNESAEKLFGYKADEVIGKSISILIPKDRLQEEPAIIARLRKGERVEHFETIRKHKDGSLIHLSLTISPIKNFEGIVIGAAKIARDITAQKRAVEEYAKIAESNVRFRTMFEQATQFAGLLTLNGTVLEANQLSLAACGFVRGDVIGKLFWECGWWNRSSDLMKMVEEGCREAAEGKLFQTETPYFIADGSERVVDLILAPVKDEAGRVIFIAATGNDVTESKLTESALRESEEKFRILAQSAPVGIFMTSLNGDCTFINEKWTEMSGLSIREAEGKGWRKALHPEDRERVAEKWYAAVKANIPFGEEYRFQRPNGSIVWLQANSLALRDSNNSVYGYIGTLVDITQRKLAEEELARSNRDLEQFAYVASHDLKEPLRTVSTYTQLFSKRYFEKIDPDANQLIQFAVEGAMRAQNLIDDLLEYSRVKSRQTAFEKVDCNEILKTVLLNLAVLIEECKAQITIDSLPTVLADKIRLTQVFQNLITNALKFCKDRTPKIHVSARKNGSYEWIFSVQDNGIGIAPQYQDRIFIIFQRLHTSSEYSGTGIGLAICKKIIEQHNGRIWVESELGKGSTFYFAIHSD